MMTVACITLFAALASGEPLVPQGADTAPDGDRPGVTSRCPGIDACAARTFEIGESDFLLDGKPFVMRCGEVHYARIPLEYWRHRLKMLRAMGCNAVDRKSVV